MPPLIERYVTDTNMIKVTIGLSAILLLVAGVFQVGPPQWFGTPHAGHAHMASPQAALAQTVMAKRQDQVAKPASDDVVMETAAVIPNQPQMAHPQSPKAQDADTVTAPLVIARQFEKTIPVGHADLHTPEQKAQFVKFMLPLILAANEEILQRRAAIIDAVDRNDRAVLERWSRLYRIDPTGVGLEKLGTQLLLRADTIPVPIALAQAAVESGWGTSRFARQGNALFGQWAWNPDAGMKPLEASNNRAVVRSFPNLFGSVRGYMHNLNTHRRYGAFRADRQKYNNRHPADLAAILVKRLDGYAEIGYAYVEKLEVIMRSNDFGRFANAQLR